MLSRFESNVRSFVRLHDFYSVTATVPPCFALHCFALVGLILRAISIWRFIRTCVRARFTIVTEMEKKLCWHNGNLLFMARFFFLSVRHFFSPTQLLLAIYSFWLCYCRHGKDKCFTNIFLQQALLHYGFFLLLSLIKQVVWIQMNAII